MIRLLCKKKNQTVGVTVWKNVVAGVLEVCHGVPFLVIVKTQSLLYDSHYGGLVKLVSRGPVPSDSR